MAAEAALVVLVTAPPADASRLAEALVQEGRAACVSEVPGLRSTFRWEGRIETADEVLLLAKTTAAGYPALEARIRELHPYDLPEILALPVAAGLEPYLRWLARSVTPAC